MVETRISTLRKIANKEQWTFNAVIQTESDNNFMVNGLRIINGKIYSPAVQYARSRYFSTNFLDTETASSLYTTLLDSALPTGTLLPHEQACKPLIISKKALDMFVPEHANLL